MVGDPPGTTEMITTCSAMPAATDRPCATEPRFRSVCAGPTLSTSPAARANPPRGGDAKPEVSRSEMAQLPADGRRPSGARRQPKEGLVLKARLFNIGIAVAM